MAKKSDFITYGIGVQMNEYPQIFGDSVHLRPLSSDIGVSENCRLCNGGAIFETRQLAEEFRAALVPVFNKRYGENNFQLCISELTGINPKDSRVRRCSDIVRWRLKTSNFNPQAKPYRA